MSNLIVVFPDDFNLIYVYNLIMLFPVNFVSKLCFQVNFTNVPPFGFVIVTCKVTITEPGKVMT